jgi:hypothetical protein
VNDVIFLIEMDFFWKSQKGERQKKSLDSKKKIRDMVLKKKVQNFFFGDFFPLRCHCLLWCDFYKIQKSLGFQRNPNLGLSVCEIQKSLGFQRNPNLGLSVCEIQKSLDTPLPRLPWSWVVENQKVICLPTLVLGG